MDSTTKIYRAKRLLTYYLRVAGAVKDDANEAEVEEIIDLLVEGITEKVREEV